MIDLDKVQKELYQNKIDNVTNGGKIWKKY